jgi:DNA-binding winged helix-turn-helix (wHTH) protein
LDDACNTVWRFGEFTYSAGTGELQKGGTALRLQDQPRRILERLLEQQGKLVTRQELQDELWPAGVNVDFDISLNAAVRRLRQVLLDDADQPRYIETLPRKGYRFIALLERIDPGGTRDPVIKEEAALAEASLVPNREPRGFGWWIGGGLAAVGAAAAAIWWTARAVSYDQVSHTSNQVSHTSILAPLHLNVTGTTGRTVAVSDDGRTIAFIASGNGERHLFLRPLGESESSQVPGTEGAGCLVFLPDSTALAWATNRGLFETAAGGPRLLSSWNEAPPVSTCQRTAAGDLLFTRIEPLPS